jgi:hypothetical protein
MMDVGVERGKGGAGGGDGALDELGGEEMMAGTSGTSSNAGGAETLRSRIALRSSSLPTGSCSYGFSMTESRVELADLTRGICRYVMVCVCVRENTILLSHTALPSSWGRVACSQSCRMWVTQSWSPSEKRRG